MSMSTNVIHMDFAFFRNTFFLPEKEHRSSTGDLGSNYPTHHDQWEIFRIQQMEVRKRTI